MRSGTADFPSFPKDPIASIAFSRMFVGLDLSMKAEWRTEKLEDPILPREIAAAF